jgi:hypothetical protein
VAWLCVFFEVRFVCVQVTLGGVCVWVTVGVLVLGPHLSGVLHQVRIVGLCVEAVSIRVG